VGKILRKNYQPSYTLGATWYPAMPILSKKNLAFRLDYLYRKRYLKSKWLFMKGIPITTVETNTMLAESLIEEHINNMHHAEKTFGKRGQLNDGVLWENFENFSWCCEHSPVKGTIEIGYLDNSNSNVKHISIPVETNFGVVCIKEKEKNYKITWSYSLS